MAISNKRKQAIYATVMNTIADGRIEVSKLLKKHPRLEQQVDDVLWRVMMKASERAQEVAEYGEK
jgi:hypothetical protein